jgi:hypothetical protein
MSMTELIVKINVPALKEAVSDTVLATPLNLLLNWTFLSIFINIGMSATQITFALTSMFFTVAVVRKYYVRQYFDKRNSKRDGK